MATVLKAGSASGVVDVGYSTTLLKLMPSGGAASVSLNGQTVSLPAAIVSYQDFPGDYDAFTVLSGTVLYVAIG